MASPHKEMDSARRSKDKSYKHVFKGSVLINTLMEYDKGRFSSRAAAIAFGQRLLDMNHVESIVGGKTFEDGAALYRWCDETLVRQAKKMVTTTSSHIPKRRLIELLDLQHGEGEDEGYDMGEMKTRVVGRLDGSIGVFEQSGASSSGGGTSTVGRLAMENYGDFEERQTKDEGGSEYGDMGFRHTTDDDRSTASRDFEDDYISILSHGEDRQSEFSDHQHDTDYAMASKHFIDDDSDNTPQYTDIGSSETPSDLESPCIESDSPIDTYLTRNETDDADTSDVPSTTSTDCLGMNLKLLRDQEQEAIADLAVMQQSLQESENNESYAALQRSLEKLTQQSSSFSDNEKQLLDQMKKMQEEHKHVVTSYEDRINQLMAKVNGIRNMADILEVKQANAQGDAAGEAIAAVPEVSVPAAPPLPGGPPAPPVPPISQDIFLPRLAQPNKPAVKPRVKMRPLFWNRIIVEDKGKDKPVKASNTFWTKLTEPNFDVDEFEVLFGKDPAKEKASTRSLHDAMSPTRGSTGSKVKTVKLLEDNRSRHIGIKLRSMHCQMTDIKDAVFAFDFDKIDEEGLFGLYELRGSAQELEKIESHLKENRNAILDQPEQFLHEVSKLCHFEERVECLILRKRFNETLFNIDEQLNSLLFACDDLRTNTSLKTVMEHVLAFGNYMNGGTQRGQADGFDITILSKLNDVKSMDKSTTLLQYIVRTHTREHEDDAGQNEARFKLPNPTMLQQASLVSLGELEKELSQLQKQVQTHVKKAEKVFNNSESLLLQPFKDKMEDFFESAEQMLKRQINKCDDAKTQFDGVLDYFDATNIEEKVTTEAFFTIWAQFMRDYNMFWKTEQKRIAKDMFAKIEKRKKERRQRAQRRKSIVEDGKSNLKQKFAQMRRRSEVVPPHTAMLLRSHSVSSLDTMSSQSSLERSLERKRTRERPSREERRSREERHSREERPSRTREERPSQDNDSVFGDDDYESRRVRRQASADPTVSTDSTPRRRSRTLVEPPSKAEMKAASSSMVDESRIKDGPSIPSRYSALGDSNIKLKLYYRKNEMEEMERKNKAEKEEKEKDKKDAGERQRHRFAPETVSKTGESMIERLQRRRKTSRVESDGNMSNTDDKKSDFEDATNPIQDRMMRRRRSRTNLFDDTENESKMQEKAPSYVRRSRTNLFSDSENEGKGVERSGSGQVPSYVRRSRTNLLSDAESESSTKTLTNMSSNVRRSRSNLFADTQNEAKGPELSLAKTSGNVRRSRANLYEDTQNEGKESNLNQMSTHVRRSRTNLFDEGKKTELSTENRSQGYMRRSRANLFDDVQNESKSIDKASENRVRSRPQQSIDSSRTSASIEHSNSTRSNAEIPSRRRLPAEPRSRSSAMQQDTKSEDTGPSWIKTIKDTASAGISAIAHKFDQTLNNTPAESKKPELVDQNHNNEQMKNHNDLTGRRVRSRRLSDLSQPDVNAPANLTPPSIVQEKSRMFTKRANTSECVVGNHPRLRAAQSMDALHKPSSLLTSGVRVRDRLSSFESGSTSGAKTRSTRSSSPTTSTSSKEGVTTRTRSRAGSDLNLTHSHDSDVSSQKSDGGIVPTYTRDRDKEALRSRDYRDVLKKLQRTRSNASTISNR